MANLVEIDIAGLQGNEAAEPRVFAHGATKILEASVIGTSPTGQTVVTTGVPTAGDTVSALDRGACIYVGVACDITVVLESQPIATTIANAITFKGCTAGSFLPILVTKVYRVGKVDGTNYSAGEVGDGTVLALF